MNKFTIFIIVSFFHTLAFAGNTLCEKNLNLVCDLKYNYENGVSKFGPSATTDVTDIQPEPFDPADCEAALVFETEAGKIVANYNDNAHALRSFVDYNQTEKMIMTDLFISTEVSASATVNAPANASYNSVTINCSLYSNN